MRSLITLRAAYVRAQFLSLSRKKQLRTREKCARSVKINDLIFLLPRVEIGGLTVSLCSSVVDGTVARGGDCTPRASP